MYSLARSILFRLPTETSHALALNGMDLFANLGLLKLAVPKTVTDEVSVMGIQFPNAVGLAAGLDKNGDHIDSLGQLGFGFIEIGTITPKAQDGNPKPRLFRLPQNSAIINRMGFNNAGVEHLVDRVKVRKYRGVLGINIGKNAKTPVENAIQDYQACLDKVYKHADYVTLNISSPNTPGLRSLQFGDDLKKLLAALKERQALLKTQFGRYVPLAVKVAPDMDQEGIASISKTLLDEGIDGLIATNTTLDRAAVAGHRHANEAGGLSGAPLTVRSTEVVAEFYAKLGETIPIIGVGGILSGEDAVEKVKAGAKLVQIYSGFIYRGPQLVAEAADAIASYRRSTTSR